MNRRKFWSKQYVKFSEMDDAFDQAEAADQAISADHGLTGITRGLTVSATAPASLSVAVGNGEAYTSDGERVVLASDGVVSLATNHLGASTAVTAGKHRCVSLFLKPARAESESHTDRTGATVKRISDESSEWYVVQGAETLLADPLDMPPLDSGMVLVRDVTLTNGMTAITASEMSDARRQDAVRAAGTPRSLVASNAPAAISTLLGYYNDHVTGEADSHSVPAASGTPFSLADGTMASQMAALLAAVNALGQTCKVYGNVAGTELPASGTWYTLNGAAPVAWDQPGGMWAEGNPDRLVALEAGKYEIKAEVMFDWSATPPTSIAVIVSKSSGAQIALARTAYVAPTSYVEARVQLVGEVILTAADYVRVRASALFAGGTQKATLAWMAMRRIG